MGKACRILLLVAILAALWIVSEHTSFPVSWPIHFLFLFTLTRLIYKDILNRNHTGLFLCAMILLMVSWETYELAGGGRISGSVALTGVDTALDLASGFLGTVAGIKTSRLFGRL